MIEYIIDDILLGVVEKLEEENVNAYEIQLNDINLKETKSVVTLGELL